MLLMSQSQEKVIPVDTLPGLHCLKQGDVTDSLKHRETDGTEPSVDTEGGYVICTMQSEEKLANISFTSPDSVTDVPVVLAAYPSKERCKDVLQALCRAYMTDPVNTVFMFPGK